MRKTLIIISSLLLLSFGFYLLTPKIIKMYACAEGGGMYSWKNDNCAYPEDFEVTCDAFIFDSNKEQADSLKTYYLQLKNSTENRKLLEQLYFCSFPKTFNQMENIFGYNDSTGAAPLYVSGLDYIKLFNSLQFIPKTQYYKRYINININGYWQADNIQGAFGIESKFVNDNKFMCQTLDSYSENDIKSVFRFMFDGPHPKNKSNETLYKKLKTNIDSTNQKISLLLTEAYEEVIKTEDGHGH
uniref:hypothetical protein n=1 Tax=Roseivirga sp. TaxID=1964215 RepID=UPI0040472F67